jgi:RNA polymerase sigma-70 factor (ECF subfamily)
VILVLAFFEDMPYPEISEVLDVPIGTVKSRVSRARAALVQLGRQAGVVA